MNMIWPAERAWRGTDGGFCCNLEAESKPLLLEKGVYNESSALGKGNVSV